MGDFHDRPVSEPVRKAKTKTVAVIATSKPPIPGFRVAGRAIKHGEEVRVPADFAKDLVRRGKARIVEGSEETVLM